MGLVLLVPGTTNNSVNVIHNGLKIVQRAGVGTSSKNRLESPLIIIMIPNIRKLNKMVIAV